MRSQNVEIVSIGIPMFSNLLLIYVSVSVCVYVCVYTSCNVVILAPEYCF